MSPGEESEGSPCAYICKLCEVQTLIDALPAADEITEGSYAEVEAKLNQVDAAKVGLTDEENELINYDKYNAAVSKMMELAGQPGSNVPMPVMQIFVKTPAGKHITL